MYCATHACMSIVIISSIGIIWISNTVKKLTNGKKLALIALAGGITLFLPFGDIIGGYYLSHPTWKIWEIVSVETTSLLILLRHGLQINYIRNMKQ